MQLESELWSAEICVLLLSLHNTQSVVHVNARSSKAWNFKDTLKMSYTGDEGLQRTSQRENLALHRHKKIMWTFWVQGKKETEQSPRNGGGLKREVKEWFWMSITMDADVCCHLSLAVNPLLGSWLHHVPWTYSKKDTLVFLLHCSILRFGDIFFFFQFYICRNFTVKFPCCILT